MAENTLSEWILSFDVAAHELLAGLPAGVDLADFKLTARRCPKHGRACVQVITGELLEHLRWETTDPAQLARQLFDRLRGEPPPESQP